MQIRFSIRTLIIAFTCIALALGVYRLIAMRVFVSSTFGEVKEFIVLPENDRELDNWISQQPGVVRASVSRDGNQVYISGIIEHNMLGMPAPPDLKKKYTEYGYEQGMSR